ncbi:hypothetical protein E3P92_04051 [Wallemia ichthyophaga]|uniref:General transcription and DNA repair factor IIH subunit TFB5 n=2 Tax=Wallemia ichthyophaga TaxID=245174 RepID=A0A4T0G194_WALIC|nr:RNA polymerase II transcription factor B subunit 5 [Wallemia ichthyophaga EXF-994]TIA77887.1 hypothetical protein E3P98_04056 [Wallemia ichthyophaga]EOQ98667.1 RNA polymerase II transcription factor B subunit 5 [Wallemia ichthyophaga EXF-994]TIA87106.1 hypothetical protein E3P97_04066 [Wallemia ichthyophaga]TIA94776.1 hypothetical protein E3P95_04076 [Wallemia ichthyophaga]TIA95177.1 hypothetical protein E3P96_03898 [Wallemia ichthyophaga]
MVKASKGILISCDPAVKQIILNLNDRKRFIIQDLDLQHILVSPDSVQTIKFEVEKELERNTFQILD